MKCIILATLAAIAYCHGGHHRGPHKIPVVCQDVKDQKKECFKNELQTAGVTFDMKEVRECYKQCPRPGADKEGEVDEEKRAMWEAKKAEWEEKKEAFAKFKTCMKDEIGDVMEKCVDGKVDFETVEKKGRGKHGHHGHHHKRGGKHGGHGGKGRGGRHGHHHGLFGHADCSEDVKACVQGVVGDWYDKQTELKAILCEAETKCQPEPNEQCKTQFEALHTAGKECYEANKDTIKSAKETCKVNLPEDMRDHKMHRKSSSESQEDDEDNEKTDTNEEQANKSGGHGKEGHHHHGGWGGKMHSKWCEEKASDEDDGAAEEE